MKSFFFSLVCLLSGLSVQAQPIFIDQPVQVGDLIVFPHISDSSKYYYLPNKIALGSDPKNGGPQFSFIRWVENVKSTEENPNRREGEGGGIIHALVELKILADQGYSPAMYYMGRLLYMGDLGYKAVPEAVGYLEMAIGAGHLPSMGLLSLIYRKEKFGLAGRSASHWLCLTKIPALVRCMWSYPSSDRLRS